MSAERLKQIVRCCEEIHRCENELAGDKKGTGAWLGYLDWHAELHYQIWDIARLGRARLGGARLGLAWQGEARSCYEFFYGGGEVNRKECPMFSGLLRYFPDAMQYVAHVSYVGNQQHNPNEPLHWAREKSTDEPDALLRHLKDAGTLDTDGLRHSGKVAWRALAMLQKEIEADRHEGNTEVTQQP